MKKIKSLILLSILGILTSCGGKTVNPPDSKTDPDDTDNPNKPNDPIVLKDFSELVKDLKTSFNVSGTIKLYQDEEADNEYTSTFNTKFTDETYHYDVTTGTEYGEVNYFKMSTKTGDYAGTYYLDLNNKPVLDYTDTTDGDHMPRSFVSNPFNDTTCDPAFFTKTETGDFYLDFSLDNGKNGFRQQAAKNLVSKLTVLKNSSYESFKIKLDERKEKIDEIEFKTKPTTDKEGYSLYYLVSMKVNSDQTIDNSANKLEPLKHEKYHDTLKSAFDYMFNNGYSFSRFDNISGSEMPELIGYYDPTTVYYCMPNNKADYSGLILKEDGVHEIVDENGKYYYEGDVLSYDGEKVTDLTNYLPSRVDPVEGFTYNEKDKTYIMETTNYASADRFVYYIDPFIDFDDVAYKSTFSKVELTLNSENKICSIISYTESGSTLEYDLEYSTKNLPFVSSELTKFDSSSSMFGTYEGTLKLVGTTDKVAKFDGKSITINIKEVANKYSTEYLIMVNIPGEYDNYAGVNVTFSNNTFYFTVDEADFVLKKEADGKYALTMEDTNKYLSYSAELKKTSSK